MSSDALPLWLRIAHHFLARACHHYVNGLCKNNCVNKVISVSVLVLMINSDDNQINCIQFRSRLSSNVRK